MICHLKTKNVRLKQQFYKNSKYKRSYLVAPLKKCKNQLSLKVHLHVRYRIKVVRFLSKNCFLLNAPAQCEIELTCKCTLALLLNCPKFKIIPLPHFFKTQFCHFLFSSPLLVVFHTGQIYLHSIKEGSTMINQRFFGNQVQIYGN